MIFRKYPKIYRVGHKFTKGVFEGEVVVEEKMDGANFRFGYDSEQDRIRYGSRKVELTDSKDLGQFEKAIKVLSSVSAEDLVPDHIYYVEYMIPHTIQYDWTKTPTFLGFDIYNTKHEVFLPYEKAMELFESVKIAFVPVIDVVDGKSIDKEYLDKVIPESKYYNGLAEGVVFKNYKKQMFAKLVAEQFKEVNEHVFGMSPKKAKKVSPEDYVLEKYFTPRRIEKVIMSLVDQGYELDMTLMKELPKKVWEDTVIEEGANILSENIVLDLKKLRKKVPKKCVTVLQRVMALKEVGAL